MDNYEKIESIVENWLIEADEEEDMTDKKTFKLFYKDLSLDGRKQVLDAIDQTYDKIDVYDDIVKENIEEALSKRPLVTMSGEEMVNKLDIDL